MNDVKMPHTIAALRLCVVRCDGRSLVSLTHRCVLASTEEDELSVPPETPVLDIQERLTRRGGERLPYEDNHENRAAIASGDEPGFGFPGWEAIFDYLDNHPELLKGKKRMRR